MEDTGRAWGGTGQKGIDWADCYAGGHWIQGYAKNSDPAGSADAGDLADLDLADSMDSGESDPGLKGFRRFRPGGLMGFRGVNGF